MGMLGRRLVVATLLLFAAVGPSRAMPLETSLALVTGNDYAPFSGEDLPQGGMMTEMVARAFKAVGLSYDMRFVPWKRGYDGVLAGKYVGTFPYIRTPERERDVLFSDPVMEVRQLVYISAKSSMEFRSPADFEGRVVCAPVGYALLPELQAMASAGQLSRESAADLPSCVRMVATGRVDAFVIDEHTGRAAVAKAGAKDSIRIAERPFSQVGLHLIVSKTNPEAAALLAAFNTGLKKVKETGEFREIMRRHSQPAP